MEKFSAFDLTKDLSDEEVGALNEYLDKCAELGVDPGLNKFFSGIEKVAEEMNAAYDAGVQLASMAGSFVDQLGEHEDVPGVLTEKAAGRYDSATLALRFADIIVGAVNAQNGDE